MNKIEIVKKCISFILFYSIIYHPVKICYLKKRNKQYNILQMGGQKRVLLQKTYAYQLAFGMHQ